MRSNQIKVQEDPKCNGNNVWKKLSRILRIDREEIINIIGDWSYYTYVWHDDLDSWCWVNGMLENNGWKCKYILKYFVKITNCRSVRAAGIYFNYN